MFDMNPEVRSQWTSALRSGDYPQGRDYLAFVTNSGVNYCCLGVLCDLAVKAGVIPEPGLIDVSRGVALDYGNVFGLPDPVLSWSGIEDRSSTSGLAHMNDDGTGFDKIADFIDGV